MLSSLKALEREGGHSGPLEQSLLLQGGPVTQRTCNPDFHPPAANISTQPFPRRKCQSVSRKCKRPWEGSGQLRAPGSMDRGRAALDKGCTLESGRRDATSRDEEVGGSRDGSATKSAAALQRT